jgi:uncharacterized protein
MNRIIFTVLTFLLVGPAFAQQKSAHYRAAENLVDALGLEKNYENSISAIIQSEGRRLPADKQQQFRGALKEFLEKYAPWPVVRPRYIAIYMEEFSEKELNDITAFYKTPSGAKFMERSPALLSKGILFGQEIALENKEEMRKIMQKYLSN